MSDTGTPDPPDSPEPTLPPGFRAVPGFNVAPGYVPPIPGGPGGAPAVGPAPVAAPDVPSEPPADALARAWRRQWRPSLLFVLLLVIGGTITAWGAPQNPGGPATPSNGEKIKGEISDVSVSDGTYVVDGTLGPGPGEAGMEVGDPVWVLTEGNRVTSIEARMPDWLFAVVVASAVLALYSLVALVIALMRRSGRRHQARDGWELVTLRSQGQGLPKRTLSPRLLLNAITLPLGIRVLAKKTGGRWYRFESPAKGSFRPRTRSGAEQLGRSLQAWVPRNVATPRLVLPLGADRFELADPFDGNPDGAPRPSR